MRSLIVVVSAAVLLSACSGRMDGRNALAARNAPAEEYVWARNDGRRMAANPDLLRQGQIDQSACRASATAGGVLNVAAFTSCMEARGYSRRRPA